MFFKMTMIDRPVLLICFITLVTITYNEAKDKASKTLIAQEHFTGIDPDLVNKKSKEPELDPDDKPPIWHTENEPNGRKRQVNLPDSFDWRNHSKCQSLFHPRNQQCGDCWAVATAAMISDRYCLYTRQDRFFSARALTRCSYKETHCDGGHPDDALRYYVDKGLVSGGDPTMNEPPGCMPYNLTKVNETQCGIRCDDGSYENPKFGAQQGLTFLKQNVTEEKIRQEIYQFGPVVSIMELCDDFFKFNRSGLVYTCSYHAVRLIGWGIQNGTKYWICANQWGSNWCEAGFCKIGRGWNQWKIETSIFSVIPMEAYGYRRYSHGGLWP